MKKFLIKSILIIVIPISFGALFIELALRRVDNEYSYKNQWLTDNASKLKIFIAGGGSYSYYGINPEIFNRRTFNGAHVSQTLDYDYLILDKFIDKMDSLETVILTIGYSSMFKQLKDVESFRISNYVDNYDLPAETFTDNFGLFSFTFSQNIEKIRRGLTSDISCDTNGFYWSKKNVDKNSHRNIDWIKNGLTRASYHHVDELNSQTYKENSMYLNKIIDLCSIHGVFVVILTSPTWSTYRDNLRSEQLNKMVVFCDSVASNNNNVMYLNMINDNRFTNDDFFDSDHLNIIGANKFTKILSDTINRIQK